MLLKNHRLVLILFAFTFCLASKLFADSQTDYLPCVEQPEKQASRSKELKEMVGADQAERADFELMTEEERLTLFKNGNRSDPHPILKIVIVQTPTPF